MNIFVLDRDPALAARYHCDRHVVKMVLETAQILCAVCHRHDWAFEGIYRLTHKNHPCTRWTGDSMEAYLWTLSLFEALLEEYRIRYHKYHACERLMEKLGQPVTRPPSDIHEKLPMKFTDKPMEFVFCGQELIAPKEDVVTRYRELYHFKNDFMLKFPMTWKNEKPHWWRR